MTNRLPLLLASMVLLAACHKRSNFKESTSTGTADVYCAGYVYGGRYNQACYWKNGQITLLPPTPDQNSNSFASGIWVQDSDVYVIGSSRLGMTLWKNNIPQVITPNASQAAAVTVDGSQVYLAGGTLNTSNGSDHAVLWDNGQPTMLPTGFPNAGADAIFVSGKDIYVLGNVTNGAGQLGEYAVYWKNGQMQTLTSDTVYSNAGGIAVANGDLYIGGTLTRGVSRAVYWKNGTMITLPSDSTSPGAGPIAVVGQDIYVAGGVYNRTRTIFNAVYWKNGQQFFLADTTTQSAATCMTANGNDVYIGGMQATLIGGNNYNEFEATYWKNGNPVTLTWPGGTPGYRYVFGIFVAAKNGSQN